MAKKVTRKPTAKSGRKPANKATRPVKKAAPAAPPRAPKAQSSSGLMVLVAFAAISLIALWFLVDRGRTLNQTAALQKTAAPGAVQQNQQKSAKTPAESAAPTAKMAAKTPPTEQTAKPASKSPASPAQPEKASPEPQAKPQQQASRPAPSQKSEPAKPVAPSPAAKLPAVQTPATKPPAKAVSPSQPVTPSKKAITPSFDIVRVEPDGMAVIAGRAAPGSDVNVLAGTRSIGTAKTNERGEWVLVLEKPLEPGNHDLSIEAGLPGINQKTRSQQRVAVALPTGKEEKPLVVVSRKGSPSRVLQEPDKTPPGRKSPVKLSLNTVDYDDKGRIMFAGNATPGTTARLYVNNKFFSDATADRDGRWVLDGSKDIPAGNHKLRIDELNAGGKVTARVELPFTRAKPADVLALNRAKSQAGSKVASVEQPAETKNSDRAAARAAVPPAVPLTTPASPPSADEKSPSAGDGGPPKIAAASPGNKVPEPKIVKPAAPVTAGKAKPKEDLKIAKVTTAPASSPAPDVKTAETPARTNQKANVSSPAKPVVEPASEPGVKAAKSEMRAAGIAKTNRMETKMRGETTPVQKPGTAAKVAVAPKAQSPAAVRDPIAKSAKPQKPIERIEQQTAPKTVQPAAQSAAARTPDAQAPAEAVKIAAVKNEAVVIQPGNNLWNISRVIYGSGAEYTVIYQANNEQIRDPDLIYPGQIFRTPGATPPRFIPPEQREPMSQ